MSGVIIYPAKVKSKAISMNSQLKEYKQNTETEKRAMVNVLGETIFLSGKAWDSARSYIRDIQMPLLDTTMLWVDAQMEENTKYHNAALWLPPVNCLDQDELERQLASWKSKLAREYRREEPSYTKIARYKAMILQINIKLNAIDSFISRTTGLYQRSAEIQWILNRADTEINKVSYDQNTNTLSFTSVDRTWVMEFERLRDIEELKAKGLTEEQIKDAKSYGFAPADVLAVWEEMQEQEISRPEIKDMEELGYSFGRTVEVWKSLDGKEDKHFFACLILGGEKKCLEAFHIDPNDLSENMTVAMAEYASCLLEHGKDEAFITLNNALLRSENTIYEMIDGIRIETLKTYRDVYLEQLYAGTAILLQGNTVSLAVMEAEIHRTGKEPDGYQVLNQKHMQEMNMCGYWATQSILIHRQGTHAEDNQFRIEAVMNNGEQGGGIDYEMGYFSPWNGCWEKVQVDNTIVNGIQMSDSWALDELKKLEEARENLVASFVMKAVEGAATVAVSYAAPEVAILVTATLMIKNGAAGTVGGLDRLTSNDLGKLTIKGGNVAAQNIINYAIQLSTLESKINAKEYRILMEWFGKGSSYNMGGETGISFAWFYDPKALCALERLETEGLGRMAGWNKEQIKSIVKAISEDRELLKNDELRAVCKEMISGGYQLVDKEYKVKNICEFGDAIENLDRIIANNSKVSLPGGIHNDLFEY